MFGGTISNISSEDASRLALATVLVASAGASIAAAVRWSNVFAWHLGFIALWSLIAAGGMVSLIAPDDWLPPFFLEALNVSFSVLILGYSWLVARLAKRWVEGP